MLTYLINTTIIWLAGLLLYEMLFRREHYHQWNRYYLLACLAAGLALPAIDAGALLPANAPAQQLQTQVQAWQAPPVPVHTVTATHTIATSAGPSTSFILLLTVYLAGVAIALLYIARQALLLLRLYGNSTKSYASGYTVAETGKVHSPFSFFHIIFVGSSSQFSTAQWAHVLAHEREHGSRLHSLDKLLLLALRIVFWFHPLPHIYYRRLMLVHEYQADAAAADTDIAGYGSFLLEQHMLNGAPLLTHSLNYSPLKNRITMLTTNKGSKARLLKYMAIMPLSLALVLCCTQTSISGPGNNPARSTATLLFKGNEITFGGLKHIPDSYRKSMEQQQTLFLKTSVPDSVLVKDYSTGQIATRAVPVDTLPVALNGQPIYGFEFQYTLAGEDKGYLGPKFKGYKTDIEQYFFQQMQEELNQLEDGVYAFNISNIVIDDKGMIAYYQNNGVQVPPYLRENRADIAPGVQRSIIQKLNSLLDGDMQFAPATKHGIPVNSRLITGNFLINVKGHMAELEELTGC